MGNEATKKQLKDFFQAALEKAQNPDMREKIKQLRKKKGKKVAKKFGL